MNDPSTKATSNSAALIAFAWLSQQQEQEQEERRGAGSPAPSHLGAAGPAWLPDRLRGGARARSLARWLLGQVSRRLPLPSPAAPAGLGEAGGPGARGPGPDGAGWQRAPSAPRSPLAAPRTDCAVGTVRPVRVGNSGGGAPAPTHSAGAFVDGPAGDVWGAKKRGRQNAGAGGARRAGGCVSTGGLDAAWGCGARPRHPPPRGASERPAAGRRRRLQDAFTSPTWSHARGDGDGKARGPAFRRPRRPDARSGPRAPPP